jgi:hypothetical protein
MVHRIQVHANHDGVRGRPAHAPKVFLVQGNCTVDPWNHCETRNEVDLVGAVLTDGGFGLGAPDGVARSADRLVSPTLGDPARLDEDPACSSTLPSGLTPMGSDGERFSRECPLPHRQVTPDA